VIRTSGTDAQEREFLLARARLALKSHLEGGKLPRSEARAADSSHQGVFVTLRQDGELRGCIGTLNPSTPLARAVESCSISAANDHRFPPLEAEDLESTRIEISVLGPARPMKDPAEIEIGRHGLIVTREENRGLLLPQVAAERGWDSDKFLEEACVKAGLPRDAWRREETRVELFSAEVFGDDASEPPTAAPPCRRC
jgi:AmmeMemoRadiSam system protein A